MYQQAKLLFLYCETSLHAGAGTGVGRIDLPIQREKHTGFPKIESSGLKGSIREVFEEKRDGSKTPKPTEREIEILFGHEGSNGGGSSHSGSLGFTDARILLFPMRSAKGIFAWVTCPRVLNQLERDSHLLKDRNKHFDVRIDTIPDGQCIAGENLKLEVGDNEQIMLEEFVLTHKATSATINLKSVTEWLEANVFAGDDFSNKVDGHLAIISDNIFAKFVELYTEIITRNKIDNETGTVQSGALWTEEYLPPGTVMYSLVLASPEFKINGNGQGEVWVMDKFQRHLPDYFQAGGNATIGKGILKANLWEAESLAPGRGETPEPEHEKAET